jgi:hypothetical protein
MLSARGASVAIASYAKLQYCCCATHLHMLIGMLTCTSCRLQRNQHTQHCYLDANLRSAALLARPACPPEQQWRLQADMRTRAEALVRRSGLVNETKINTGFLLCFSRFNSGHDDAFDMFDHESSFLVRGPVRLQVISQNGPSGRSKFFGVTCQNARVVGRWCGIFMYL